MSSQRKRGDRGRPASANGGDEASAWNEIKKELKENVFRLLQRAKVIQEEEDELEARMQAKKELGIGM